MEQIDITTTCFICKEELGDTAIEVSRGIDTLKKCSSELQDGNLTLLENAESIKVHKRCRSSYVNRKTITQAKRRQSIGEPSTSDDYTPTTKKLRTSVIETFDWKIHCFICGEEADEDKEKKLNVTRRKLIHVVSSSLIKQNILDNITGKRDDFSRNLLRRLSDSTDLVAIKAKYHKSSLQKVEREYTPAPDSKNFFADKVDKSMEKVFFFLDNNDDCQFTITELKDSLGEDDHIPASITIITRLKSHYGENNIIVSNKNNSPTLICLKKWEYNTLSEAKRREKYKVDDKNEDFKSLKKAAEILMNSVRSVVCTNHEYPPSDKMFEEIEESIPEYLRYFLEELILAYKKGDTEYFQIKCTSIGHAIMSAIRPRSFVSPLQVSLAVTLHCKFGSRKMIDICSSLGFCATYHEARRYEHSAACHNGIVIKNGAFLQFACDNTDFNVNTIDGKNTFHYMGSIKIVTPSKFVENKNPIPRVKGIPSEAEIKQIAEVPIKSYNEPIGKGLKTIKVSVNEEIYKYKVSNVSNLNILWMYGKHIIKRKFTGWNGFMEFLTSKEKYEKSRVVFMPFLNAPPSEYNTLYSTILVTIQEALKNNMKTCIITADQPLYVKIVDIIHAINLSDQVIVIAKLGLHTIMSFMGSIGYIMAGSGLKELLCTVYGENTAGQIMIGHSYARGIRAHILLLLALSKKIFEELEEEDPEFAKLASSEDGTLCKLLCSIGVEEVNIDNVESDKNFQKLIDIFRKKMLEIEKRSDTAKLWINYIRMVSILIDYVSADRMGKWELHVKSSESMIPYFHAAGHLPYAKAVQIYVQHMRNLKDLMKDEKELQDYTENGFFAVRRTDKFFCGIPTDHTLESSLNKFMSCEGGPFKRSATIATVFKWITGTVYTQDIIEGIEKYCKLSFSKSYQHDDASDARIEIDDNHLEKFIGFLNTCNPFQSMGKLKSIATGVSADESINCHKAFEVGMESIKCIDGQNFKDLKLKRNDKCLPLQSVNSTIKVHEKVTPIDHLLLLQRYLVLKQSDDDLRVDMKHEMSTIPMALFDEEGMRKTAKSKLYDAFQTVSLSLDNTDDFIFVVDGLMLLHRVRWKLNEKFLSIIQQYIHYLKRNYGSNAMVVFDGYDAVSTKSSERVRRASKQTCTDIEFTESTELAVKQDVFLTNSQNKQLLIKLLCKHLTSNNINFYNAEEDADLLIVKTAITQLPRKTVVVSDDIDVLVLLNALTPLGNEIYFLKLGSSFTERKIYSSNSFEDPSCKQYLLFLHSFTGCDTTSAFFNRSKKKFVADCCKRADLQDAAKVFIKKNQSLDQLYKAGEICTLAIYGAPQSETDLNLFRYKCFVKAVTKKVSVKLSFLPPTLDAAIQHFKRVYYQIQTWSGEKLSAESWGWKKMNDTLIPVKMSLSPAPQKLLEIIFCSCKTGCGNACGCRKAGLYCSVACAVCCGNDCLNCPLPTNENEIEEEEELCNDEIL